MSCHARGAKNEIKSDSSTGHGRPVVHPTDRGEPITAASSFLLGYAAEIDRASL